MITSVLFYMFVLYQASFCENEECFLCLVPRILTLEFCVKITTVMCLAKMILPLRGNLISNSKLLNLFCDSLYVHLSSDFSYSLLLHDGIIIMA